MQFTYFPVEKILSYSILRSRRASICKVKETLSDLIVTTRQHYDIIYIIYRSKVHVNTCIARLGCNDTPHYPIYEQKF